MHVVQFLVERDRVCADRGNRAPLGLPGIVIRRREDNLVADLPASGVQDVDRVAACVSGPDSFVQEFVRLPCRFRVPPKIMIPRSPTLHGLFIRDGIGEGNRRLARVGAGFGADFQFPVQHDPLGGQFEVSVVGEAEFAVDRQAAQRRGLTSRTTSLPAAMVTLSPARAPSVGPSGRIRPARLPGRRRSGILSLNDSECADEQECRQERSKQERAMLVVTESTLRTRR